MSFPRAGRICAAQILAELGDVRDRFQTEDQLAAEAGVCPVTRASGRSRGVSFRWACNHRLRRAITCFADNSRHASAPRPTSTSGLAALMRSPPCHPCSGPRLDPGPLARLGQPSTLQSKVSQSSTDLRVYSAGLTQGVFMLANPSLLDGIKTICFEFTLRLDIPKVQRRCIDLEGRLRYPPGGDPEEGVSPRDPAPTPLASTATVRMSKASFMNGLRLIIALAMMARESCRSGATASRPMVPA